MKCFTGTHINRVQEHNIYNKVRTETANADTTPWPSSEKLPIKPISQETIPKSSKHNRIRGKKRKSKNEDTWRPLPVKIDWDKLIQQTRAKRLKRELQEAEEANSSSMNDVDKGPTVKQWWEV